MLYVACLVVFVTILLQNHSMAAMVATRELPFVYPEPGPRVASVEDDVPASCRDLNYCTIKPKNYPEEKFNMMFKDYKPAPQPELVAELGNKFGDGDENCQAIPTNEPLYTVREKRDKPWRMVVQAPRQAYIQHVLLHTCSNEGKPCFQSFCTNTAYKSSCKQIYYTWELLVQNGDNETEKIKAELPGACSCYAEKVEFQTRIGIDMPEILPKTAL